ncbi:MAG: hypothetical protein DRO23_13075 [Thermoprotei archaeon]|nr:MAG: hypothetical protein DRO23_13075 [Thermoprotei archaeon]
MSKSTKKSFRMKPRTIRLPQWLWEILEDISEKELRSISSIIREAVKEHVKRKGYPVD